MVGKISKLIELLHKSLAGDVCPKAEIEINNAIITIAVCLNIFFNSNINTLIHLKVTRKFTIPIAILKELVLFFLRVER